MKTIQGNMFRAIASLATGILLIMYPDDTAQWMTIAIGALFLVSGLISCVAYYAARKSGSAARSPFPIVAAGSVALGLILIVIPGTIISIMSYILGAILILGALNQMIDLIAAARAWRVPAALWICPSLVLLVGVTAIVKPMWIAAAPLVIIGWCLLLYGVTEIVNALKINACRKRAAQNALSQNDTTEQGADDEDGNGQSTGLSTMPK